MKNLLVIGGSSGIGEKLIESLSDGNYKIYEISRSGNSASHIESLSIDISTDEIPSDFLPEYLDGIVYCPGTINLKPFRSLKDDDYLTDYRVNVLGALKTIKSALKSLKKSERTASIVLFSTVAVAQGMRFHTSIAAAKGAIEGITRSLAAELAPKIRVNCIAPSLTNTPLAEKLLNTPEKIAQNNERHPLKRIGQPEDIVNAVKFLLGEKSSWMTGQVLNIDGGMSTLKV